MSRYSVALLSCLFVVAIAIIGCGGGGGGGGGSSNPVGPTVLNSGEMANLSGTVLFDNAPLAFASVFLYKSEKAHTIGMAQLPSLKGSLVAQQVIGDGAYTTTTDAAGIYNFINVPVGQYTLIAMRDENHQFVQTGVLLGQVTTLNPQLKPTGKITGKVTQSVGGVTQNISGAFVYITGTCYIALTDASGTFMLSNVPSNSLGEASYEVQVIHALGDTPAKTGITVYPGEATDIGIFSLAPKTTSYQILSGSLTARTGVTSAQLAGIFVMLTRQEDGSMLGTSSDSSGNFLFSVTRPGNYVVMAANTDFLFDPASIRLEVTSLDNGTTSLAAIYVDAARTQNTGSIVGSVSMAGSPVAGAVVHASGTSLLGVSNAAGKFTIDKVPANTSATPYTLEISSSLGTAAAKTGVVVSVGQATDVGAFAITLPATGYKTITGQLVAVAPVTTAQLANRLVQITSPDGKVNAAYSDSSGAFSFMATQTGAHTVTVIDPEFGYAPRTQTSNVSSLDNASQALSQQISVSLLDNTGSITGQVTSMGSPLSGAVVCVTGTPLLGVSDSGGNFIIGKVPANSPTMPYTLEVSSNMGTAPAITDVVVSAGQTTNAGIFAISLPAAGYKTITGQLVAIAPVTTAQLANCLIQITAPDGKVSAAYTDSSGAFSCMATQTGNHSVTVIDSQLAYSPRTQSINITALDNSTQALSPINASIADNRVSIEGTVTWPAVAGWTFTEGELILESASFVERRIVSNVSPASYRFDNVPPGAYTLRSNPIKSGYGQGYISFSVTEGTNITGQTYTPNFIAPLITSVSVTGNTLTVGGMNFGAYTPYVMAVINDKPIAATTAEITSCSFSIPSLPPGIHAFKVLVGATGNQLTSNMATFTVDIAPPVFVSKSSTSSSITFTWQNAPYVTQVDVSVMEGTDTVATALVSGNTYTFKNLKQATTYTIIVRSTYPNVGYSSSVTFNANTLGVNTPTPLNGGPFQSYEKVFGFEVFQGVAYIAAEYDSYINLYAYNLSTDWFVDSTSFLCEPNKTEFRSMAVNSNGVFLTYDTISGVEIKRFPLNINDVANPPISQNFTTDYFFTSPTMAKLRCFNDRIFLVTVDGNVKLNEINPNNLMKAGGESTFDSGSFIAPNKSADITFDPLTDTIYLTYLEDHASPTDPYPTHVLGFNIYTITVPDPTVVKNFTMPSTTTAISGLYAANNKIYLSFEQSESPGLSGRIIDVPSGYSTTLNFSPGNFAQDQQNRLWVTSSDDEGHYFLQLDSCNNVQLSLPRYNGDYSTPELTAAKLDYSTGMMYMLDVLDGYPYIPVVYKYDSNY